VQDRCGRTGVSPADGHGDG